MPHRSRGLTHARPWVLIIAAVLMVTGLAPAMATGPQAPSARTAGSAAVSDPVAGLPAAGAAARGNKPNVVLFVMDDMRADEIRYLPRTRAWMRRNGIRYTDAISPHPLCCPARAELSTGQYAQNNGVHHNTGPAGGFKALEEPDNNVGAWLQRGGYETAYTGKYLNGYTKDDSGWFPEVDGWDVWDPMVRGVYRYTKSRFFNGDRFHRYTTRVIRQRSERAMRMMDKQDPFFLYVNHTAPHDASKQEVDTSSNESWAMPKYERRYAKAYRTMVPPVFGTRAFLEARIDDLPADMQGKTKLTRASMLRLARSRARALRSADDAIMGTISDLRRSGRLEDTYVVFTSDNGYHLGEHDYKGKNLMFDASLRVPLFVSAPSRRAGTVDTPVSLVDLPATIAQWTGSRPGRPQDGRPLPALGDPEPGPQTMLIQAGSKRAPAATDHFDYRGVRTPRYLFAYDEENRNGVLFDDAVDPEQLVNRFDDPRYSAVRSELLERTMRLADCAGLSCRRDLGEDPLPTGKPQQGWQRPDR